MTVKTAELSHTVEQNGVAQELPPLAGGDRLTRDEFERRYHAQPNLKKAERIEGVVYMPSPVRYRTHGSPHLFLGGWVANYMAATPGVGGGDTATVRMGLKNDPQPDLLLRIEREQGGHSFITQDDYIEGAPELIIEVAGTSANYDMHDKKEAYARNGVREYLVVLTHDQTVHWFVLRDGEYEELARTADGILQSEFFAGLWLKPAALWANNLAEILAVLQQGLATADHAALVERLAVAES